MANTPAISIQDKMKKLILLLLAVASILLVFAVLGVMAFKSIN